MDDLESGLRRILNNEGAVDLFFADVEQALVMHGTLADFVEQVEDPADMRRGLAAFANASESLATALLQMPSRSWAHLWVASRSNKYLRFTEPEAQVSDQSLLPAELNQLADVARQLAGQLKRVRSNRMFSLPDTERATYVRNQMINTIADSYRRHVGSLDVAGWSEGGVFARVVDAVLYFAGLERISDRTLRTILGKSTP